MIKTIKYYNFRNFDTMELHPSPGVTILVGKNASGKTNTLEGIQLLTTGLSFRHATSTQLIRHEQTEGSLFLETTDQNTHLLKFINNKKYLYINNKKHALKDIHGRIPTVLFYPDELFFIKGSKTDRRILFDEFGSQINKTYHTIYQDYLSVLLQRNKLLKTDYIDDTILHAWTDSLIHIAESFYIYRMKLIESITPFIIQTYQQICPEETLGVVYKTKDIDLSCVDGNNIPAAKEYIHTTLEGLFQSNDSIERITHKTQYGPHCDDIIFTINSQSAKEYGSQGQQRSVILAIKIAFIKFIHSLYQTYPLLLLDDVMSELDEQRRHHLFKLMDADIQTILTTTHLNYFSQDEISNSKIVRYGD